MTLRSITIMAPTLLLYISTWAQKGFEPLLDSLYNKQNRPLIILNYTSSDCVNCRLGVSSMLPALANRIGSSHIEILTDHKNQLRYLNKFPEVFGKYKVQVSKELSQGLSQDGSSKIYIVGKNKLMAYSLNSSSDSLVNEIIENYNRLGSSGSKTTISKIHEYNNVDTVFDPMETMFEASTNTAVLFSRKFQLGKQCDLKNGINRDFEFTANAKAVTTLNKMLKSYDPRIYVTADSAIKVLNVVTLPMIYVENLRIASGKCYIAFKYNSVTIDGGPQNDPDIGIRPRYFIGVLDVNKSGVDVADLSQCEKFYLIDTSAFKGHTYKSNFWSVIDIRDNNLALRCKGTDTQSALDSTLYVSSCSMAANNRPKLESVEHFKNEKSNDEMLLRYGFKDQLVIWNQSTKTFRNHHNETVIPAKQLNDLGLTYVYDFFAGNDALHLIGVINNKQAVLITYAKGTASIEAYFDDHSFCDGFRFADKNNIVGYIKDLQKNTLRTITYSYSMAKPETP